MCGHNAAVIAGSVVGGFVAFNALAFGGLFGVLHRLEKKERRALQNFITSTSSLAVEEKTVVIENRGPAGGAAGTAGLSQVVTTGPSGTKTSIVPTSATGAVLVSTSTAGVPGGVVTVEPGKTAIVKTEQPIGKPEEAKIVSTVEHPIGKPEEARVVTSSP